MEAPRPRVLLIAGPARSGSTALDFMLGNRPDAFSLGEIYSWFRPSRAYHLSPDCNCGEPVASCPVWGPIGRPSPRHLYRAVVEATGATTLVDSSKNLNWVRDAHRWAAADDLAPRVVLTWRRPEQAIGSYWKRWSAKVAKGTADPGDRRTAQEHVDGWTGYMEGYLRRLDDLRLPYEVVDFDALIADPTAELDRLHTRLGMAPHPGQERFWEGSSHSLFGSEGTRAQVRSGTSRLEPSTLPDAFLDLWDSLAPEQLERIQRLHDTVRARIASGYQPDRRPRVDLFPPPWYVKSRVIGTRKELALRRRVRRSQG